ncbi:hypothetical protein [Pseudomonas sp. UMAB-40]|uniref:hypothetical protein n=1 Tax=Pseudomonas sp. UMAB-40 TaxID=1365407 RepID=UPI001C5A3A64|nr:hypothetical protein [Pseudomonas sp. UMAB-40]
MSNPSLAAEEKIKLFGQDGAFTPKPTPPANRPAEALRLFQGFLCNSELERNGLGNVIALWEQIPKYSGEHLNNKDGLVPNDHVIDFTIGDQDARVTLFPGTYYPNRKNSQPKRRFPGVREQAVEQAIIHHACLQAETHSVKGEVAYYVKFSISGLARTLKFMGSTLSNTQIREALEVLSSSIMTIGSGENLLKDNRDPILPGFERNKDELEVSNGDDVWRVKLHPLIAHAILNVTYRQFPMGITKDYTPPGAYLIRYMHYIVPNISTATPFSFRLSEMKRLTAGLNHTRIAGSMAALLKDLDKMKLHGLLEYFDVEQIFPVRRPRGRPSPIDFEITMYPGREWIKNVKAASTRVTVTEQSLGLPRSERQQRQLNLPNF